MGLYLRSVLEGAKNHSGKYPMIERQWHSAINSQRTTQLIVALQLHRLEHGEFPRLLTELEIAKVDHVAMIDSTTWGTYLYSAVGFGVDFRLRPNDASTRQANYSLQIKGRQPILWTNGGYGPNTYDKSDDGASIDVVFSMNPNRILYIDGRRGMFIPLNHLWGENREEADYKPKSISVDMELP